MKEIVEWCNINNGFLTAVLSLLTLIVSIIAIIVAVRSARLPYKKKILVETGHYFSDAGYGIHVTATNIGNRDVVLTSVCLVIGDQTCLNPHTFSDSKGRLRCGEATSQYYSSEMLQNALRQIPSNSNDKVYGLAKDTEGKEYRKRIGTVEKLKKHISL